MKYILNLIICCACFFPLWAQQPSLEGEYYLTGVRETASGLKLSADSSFEFYFSSGALDRMGKGKWTVRGNNIVLNAVERNGDDFTFQLDSTIKGSGMMIKIDDRKSNLYLYVLARIWKNGKEELVTTNSRGELISKTNAADSIHILFQFVPERVTKLIPAKGKNYFEYIMEPWLFDIYFENQVAVFKEGGLTMWIPFINNREMVFKKGSE